MSHLKGNTVTVHDPSTGLYNHITSSKNFVQEVYDYVQSHGAMPTATKNAPSGMLCVSGWVSNKS